MKVFLELMLTIHLGTNLFSSKFLVKETGGEMAVIDLKGNELDYLI